MARAAKNVENFWKRLRNEYLEHIQNLNDDPGKPIFMSTKYPVILREEQLPAQPRRQLRIISDNEN